MEPRPSAKPVRWPPPLGPRAPSSKSGAQSSRRVKQEPAQSRWSSGRSNKHSGSKEAAASAPPVPHTVSSDEEEEQHVECFSRRLLPTGGGSRVRPPSQNSDPPKGVPPASSLAWWRLAARRGCLLMLLMAALSLLVYVWPLAEPFQVEPKVAPLRPRPLYAGGLAVNERLDVAAEKLWEGQFHAPESLAWTADRRRFFTGVEGGFILLVEPYAERWTVAARLNGRLSVEDQTAGVLFRGSSGSRLVQGEQERSSWAPTGNGTEANGEPVDLFAPFCTKDVQLYGKRAEFEPALVRLSRCSRPLGLRLSPDESRLYVMDPMSGLYKIRLLSHSSTAHHQAAPNSSSNSPSDTQWHPLGRLNHVIKLLDFTKLTRDSKQASRPTRESEIYFGDDIAVQFNDQDNREDVVYFTDCSRRWTLRYLIWMMLENDDSGRVMRFHVGKKELSKLDALNFGGHAAGGGSGGGGGSDGGMELENLVVEKIPSEGSGPSGLALDLHRRNLSFPNGLELTANGSALLVSDLNNRRILMHHLEGPLRGQTKHLMWVPGFSDNIKRGLDTEQGEPTYWFACGCALPDGRFELFEFLNSVPWLKRLALRWFHFFGSALDWLGTVTSSTTLRDLGLEVGALWLKHDPYCSHGLVAQFNERGQVIRSLHGPKFSSNFKLLSEASEVPNLNRVTNGSARSRPSSTLFLGSVYYSYLGRVHLDDDDDNNSY